MQPKLFFGINLHFDLTINEQLKELSALKVWDKGLQKYLYIFNIGDLGTVIRLTGQKISFDDSKQDILNILQYAPTMEKEIDVEKFKGKGYFNLTRFPKLFLVETIVSKRPKTSRIPVEKVTAAWNACLKFDIGKSIPFKRISEEYCKEVGIIDRFTRQSGSYDSSKFFGTREDTSYFDYNLCMKILYHYELITYSKGGYVTRLMDKWEEQERFES